MHDDGAVTIREFPMIGRFSTGFARRTAPGSRPVLLTHRPVGLTEQYADDDGSTMQTVGLMAIASTQPRPRTAGAPTLRTEASAPLPARAPDLGRGAAKAAELGACCCARPRLAHAADPAGHPRSPCAVPPAKHETTPWRDALDCPDAVAQHRVLNRNFLATSLPGQAWRGSAMTGRSR